MATRDDGVTYSQHHNFIGSGAWGVAPVKAALLAHARRMAGGDAWLIVDDVPVPRRAIIGGVAPRYNPSLGKNAPGQSLPQCNLPN